MTKIDIISGFLGAGKTTLIKKLIEEGFKGEKLVLIENEFGEIGIDGGFLKDLLLLSWRFWYGFKEGYYRICTGQNHYRAIRCW